MTMKLFIINDNLSIKQILLFFNICFITLQMSSNKVVCSMSMAILGSLPGNKRLLHKTEMLTKFYTCISISSRECNNRTLCDNTVV